jgi:hypothetical protein
MPFEIFELEIEKEATLDLWEYLGELLRYSIKDSDREEITEMLESVLDRLNEVGRRFAVKSEELNYTMKCFDCVKKCHDEPCNRAYNPRQESSFYS